MLPKFEGKSLKGTDQAFLAKVMRASEAVGVTKIDVYSAKRDAATNTGVSNSNHLYGHAIDARAFIPGKGWVSLGTALLPVATEYGLRSGDVDGFYKGAHDPPHVDDGYNQGGVPDMRADTPQPQEQPSAATPEAVATPPAAPAPSFGQSLAIESQTSVPLVTPPVLEGQTAVSNVDYTRNSRMMSDIWQQIAALPDASPESQRYASILKPNV